MSAIHTPFPQTVLESFALQRKLFPTRDAVVAGDSISYDGLERYSNRIASCLLELGQRGLPVATFLGNGIDYVAAILGIGKSGNLFLPLEAHWPAARVTEVLSVAAPCVILSDEAHKPALLALARTSAALFENAYLVTLQGGPRDLRVETFVKGQPAPVIEMAFPEDAPAVEVPADASLYLLPTSGSTGKPKIIEGRHRSLAHFLAWERAELGLGHEVRCLAMAPVSFDVSLRDIFLPLTSGGTLCVPPRQAKENPAALLRWIGEHGVNVVHLVPSVIRLLVQACADEPALREPLSSLRYVLSAGEPLYGSDVLGLRESLHPRLEMINLYGLTETTLAKVFNRIGEIADPHRVIPLGRPIPDTRIVIMDGERECPPGEVGEICIQTAYPAKGFFRDEALTREKYRPVDGGAMVRFGTRDLGQIQADGLVVYHGRMDDQVKIRGNRVELLEVEQCLMNHPGIRKVALIPQADAAHEISLLCFYLSTSGQPLQEEKLRAHLEGQLPAYMHPARFIHMAAFPVRLNGKLDKPRLLEQAGQGDAAPSAQTPPSGEVETRLAAFWRDIFKTDRIYRESSFIALGGSSLNAMRLISRINKEFQLILQIADIFGHPTLSALAQRVAETGHPEPETVVEPIPAIPPREDYPISSFQKAVWDLSFYEPLKAAYNEAVCWRVERELDAGAAQAILDALVEKYEILRTSFHHHDIGCRQKVHAFEPGRCRIGVVDLSGNADPMGDFERHFQDLVQTPFDLENPPLFRCVLFRIGGGVTVVAAVLFHIIVDLWSVDLMLREVLALAGQAAAGRAFEIEPLKIQYKDYAVWQRKGLDDPLHQKRREFWKTYLQGELPVLDLGSRPRPPVKKYGGGMVRASLDAVCTRLVRQQAENSRATLFAYLLSAFARLLHQRAAGAEVVVGVPVSAREHPDLENQFGNFLNILPVRIAVPASNRQLLQEVNANLMQVLEHRSYPIQAMIEDKGARPDLSRSPFFDVSFTVVPGAVGEDSSVRELKVNKGTSKYDLSLFVYDDGKTLELVAEYNTSLFGPEDAQQVMDQFRQLLPLVP